MEFKLEHVLLFLLFVFLLKMIMDKCGCKRLVEGARPRKTGSVPATPANQPPTAPPPTAPPPRAATKRKGHSPPTPPAPAPAPPSISNYVSFPAEGWKYSNAVNNFTPLIKQCNPNGTGKRVHICSQADGERACENFYTETSAIDNDGGYHKCKTLSKVPAYIFGGPEIYTCYSDSQRCKLSRPCNRDGNKCANISDLQLDPTLYDSISYEFISAIDGTPATVKSKQNTTEHTYYEGSGVYKVMQHLKDYLQIQKIQVGHDANYYKITIWVNAEHTWTFFDKSGDQYDVGSSRNKVNHDISVRYKSDFPLLEFVTHNG